MEINPKKSNTLTTVYYTNVKYILSTNNPKKIKKKKTNKPSIIKGSSFLGNFPSKAF